MLAITILHMNQSTVSSLAMVLAFAAVTRRHHNRALEMPVQAESGAIKQEKMPHQRGRPWI
jgi:hypothetical protein